MGYHPTPRTCNNDSISRRVQFVVSSLSNFVYNSVVNYCNFSDFRVLAQGNLVLYNDSVRFVKLFAVDTITRVDENIVCIWLLLEPKHVYDILPSLETLLNGNNRIVN